MNFFIISLAVFWAAAFASASNDVAVTVLYVGLEKEQQSFLGIRSTFYRLSMLTGWFNRSVDIWNKE
jgi:PAT family beta-lactamase induction signal transducer AmpG